MDIAFDIEKDFGTIGSGSAPKRLCLVSWNHRPAKLDIRPWRDDENGGGKLPGKGITLTDEEGRFLLAALQEYFAEA